MLSWFLGESLKLLDESQFQIAVFRNSEHLWNTDSYSKQQGTTIAVSYDDETVRIYDWFDHSKSVSFIVDDVTEAMIQSNSEWDIIISYKDKENDRWMIMLNYVTSGAASV